MRWWDREAHRDRRPLLLARNRIKSAIRAWFEAEGFVEVDPALLVVSPGNELHLHALSTNVTAADGQTRARYLHTSPEFAMKKLLAAGERRIFAFARVFRDREGGPRHSPEFTMLEWYRADESYERLMEDCAAILRIAADAADVDRFGHGSLTCDPRQSPVRKTVAAECARHGVDLLATLDGSSADATALAGQLAATGITAPAHDTWSDLFSRLLNDLVEPGLGPGPVILDAYPAPEAALARKTPGDPRLAERFELFACGVELANAFGELTDPAEQRARFEADMTLREAIYGVRYPIDEDLLQALSAMPPSAGAALGFDRLVMLATQAPRVTDVMWSPPA